MLRLRRLVPALATAVCALTLTAGSYVFAQTAPVVTMQPGTYYDPANCVGVQLAGGLYLCTAPTPTPAPITLNGAPLCDGQSGRPAHDPTKWHPLTVNNPDGSVLCTYGHEHGMDPTKLDSVFGPLPLAQQISYPWETVSSTGVLENSTANKHRVYKWIEASGLPCTGAAPDGSSKIVTAFREELHADGNLGASVRFHSYWGQYQLTDCSTGEVGTMTVGGHMDYAQLTAGQTKVALPADGTVNACVLNGDTRQEGALGAPEQSSSVWYGVSSRAQISAALPTVCDDRYTGTPHISVGLNVGTDGWGPVDPSNPTVVHFYSDRDKHHGTLIASDDLAIWNIGFPTDATGHVNFTGHVDSQGDVVPEVAGKPEGSDYIPLVLKNIKPRAYGSGLVQHPVGYNGDVPGPQGQPGYYVENPS